MQRRPGGNGRYLDSKGTVVVVVAGVSAGARLAMENGILLG